MKQNLSKAPSPLTISFTVTSYITKQEHIDAIPLHERDAMTGEVAAVSKVVRHPNLLMSSRMDLSMLERKIFFLCLREIKAIQAIQSAEIKPFQEINFAVDPKEVTAARVGQSFKKVISDIKKKQIEWNDSKGNRVSDVIYIRSIYVNGVIHLLLNYKLFPLFLDLSRGYTDYEIDNVLALTSEYAQILYPEFCRKLSLRPEWKLTLKELRHLLIIKDGQYLVFRDFKRRVLDTAITQINRLTDLTASYKLVKVGRQVESIVFSFHKAKKLSLKEQARKELIAEINKEVEKVMETNYLKLVSIATDILQRQYPTFTLSQSESIVQNKDLLTNFIRADIYANQLPDIIDRQAYVAEAVFGYKKAKKTRDSS